MDFRFAYIDPGTGSYLIQLLLGVVLGGAFAVKAFWSRIKQLFNGSPRRKKDE